MQFNNAALILSVTTLMVVLGCHSTPLKNQGPRVSLSKQNEWLTKYKKARELQESDKAQSCKLFNELSEDKKFPVRRLAELRLYETCPELQTGILDRSQLPEYLEDLGLEVALKLAALGNDKVLEMDLAFEKSRQRLTQKEKVRWANLAITRAEETSHFDKAEEFRKRLYKIAPRLDPQPRPKNYLEIATDYRMARQFAKAHEYYEKVIAGPGFTVEQKISAFKGIRLAHKNARAMETHLESSLRLVNFLKAQIKANPKSQSLRMAAYDAETFYARALWTQHRNSEARAIFDSIERRLKGRVSLAELYWLKGRMAEEQRDYNAVAGYMELALAEKTTNSELRDKILWYSAWNERLRGNLSGAVGYLKELDEKTSSEFVKVRALYWLGKTYLDARRDDEANSVFTKLIEVDPLGYYGLLAHRQLGLEIKMQNVVGKPNEESEASAPFDVNVAEWLALLDERESLRNLLDIAAEKYGKQKEQNDDGWTVIFKYYAKGGLFSKLYESLGRLTPERRKSILQSHPELLFPQPWSDDVRSAALQFGVTEELIYAIMRQESAFDPKARSVADAFGLMQVLPEIAETLASTNKIRYEQMEDLYLPQTNISVGTAHIKELLARYRGQFILAVAAYNANDNAIRNWMKTRYRGDALEFIEEIPYEETRAYVRLVMRNMIFYSLLKSKNASIEFPQWVLKLDAT